MSSKKYRETGFFYSDKYLQIHRSTCRWHRHSCLCGADRNVCPAVGRGWLH